MSLSSPFVACLRYPQGTGAWYLFCPNPNIPLPPHVRAFPLSRIGDLAGPVYQGQDRCLKVWYLCFFGCFWGGGGGAAL
ncbi:hypothetical protein B0O99DRAFT_360295 [Bisporella sp. PMI_857]|nr:hypothetical protein B0O99DRAFT_360295 [Bisporella sp. PMI_857]